MPIATSDITIRLPEWLRHLLQQEKSTAYESVESRMQLVIHLAQRNVEEGTGGPFAAAVFDMEKQTLISAGVNLVVAEQCSIAHAEIVAITAAQQRVGIFDLGAGGMPHCQLVSSSEPCAMCFGAIPWSGIRHLICGATAEDAEAIGFDEGDKVPGWEDALRARGITVETAVCREKAAAILKLYATTDGFIYNSRQGQVHL